VNDKPKAGSGLPGLSVPLLNYGAEQDLGFASFEVLD